MKVSMDTARHIRSNLFAMSLGTRDIVEMAEMCDTMEDLEDKIIRRVHSDDLPYAVMPQDNRLRYDGRP